MTKGGVWMVQTDEDKIEQNNFPQGVVNGWVRVYRNSNGATKQVFYRYGTNDKTDGYVYTRTYNVNSKNWSRWTSYARMSDLTDNLNHKKQILPWGNYGDGNHSISNFTFGSNLYIAVGTSAKVQKRCSIISPNDSIQIPHPEGFITIVFNDTNHITVSGTTGNYQLREIRASDLLGV